MTTAEQRIQLRALAERATPGPRHACEDDGIWEVAPGAECSGEGSFILTIGTDRPEADARFASACDPQTVLALLDAADERDRLLVQARKVIAGIMGRRPSENEVIAAIDAALGGHGKEGA